MNAPNCDLSGRRVAPPSDLRLHREFIYKRAEDFLPLPFLPPIKIIPHMSSFAFILENPSAFSMCKREKEFLAIA